MKDQNPISNEAIKEWQKKTISELKESEFKGLEWKTPEGIKLQSLYTSSDLENLEWKESFPGFFPFVRGGGSVGSGRGVGCRGHA